MKNLKILTLIGLLAFVTNACADLAVTNLNDPDRQRAIQTPGDVEALISGSYNSVYLAERDWLVCPFSTAANSHASSWGNWGMKDSRFEPRTAYDNQPSAYAAAQAEALGDAYGALAGARDGLAAIAEGLTIDEGGVDVTPRAVAFGTFVPGLAHANLARLYDQGFIIDENTDLAAIELVPSEQLFQAAIGFYDEAIQIAQSNTFTIPEAWVGHDQEWSNTDMVGFIKAWKVRGMIQMPRSEAERAAVDWNQVLSLLADGLPFDYVTYDDGTSATWGYHRSKDYCGGRQTGWSRMDMRTIGPSDVSGAWETWINQADPWDKEPFDITTPDSRITEPFQPQTEGKYFRWLGNSPFPASRGIWTHSNYTDWRWPYASIPGKIGDYPDYVEMEVDFIRAEAWYRAGQFDNVREVVNQYRANGDLPPFVTNENPDGPDVCVPQNANGTCGDLWEALKYEKRIENYHYGSASEFMDDRGWGDLYSGTWLEMPVPGEELLLLLMKIYSFGANLGNGAPAGTQGTFADLLNDYSPEALRMKRMAYDAYLWDLNESQSPDSPGKRR